MYATNSLSTYTVVYIHMYTDWTPGTWLTIVLIIAGSIITAKLYSHHLTHVVTVSCN